MPLRLRKDLVLVEPVEQPSTIILPDEVTRKTKYGRVTNVGTEGDMQVGEIIAFAEAVGEKTKIDGKEQLVMRVGDVLATVDW